MGRKYCVSQRHQQTKVLCLAKMQSNHMLVHFNGNARHISWCSNAIETFTSNSGTSAGSVNAFVRERVCRIFHQFLLYHLWFVQFDSYGLAGMFNNTFVHRCVQLSSHRTNLHSITTTFSHLHLFPSIKCLARETYLACERILLFHIKLPFLPSFRPIFTLFTITRARFVSIFWRQDFFFCFIFYCDFFFAPVTLDWFV